MVIVDINGIAVKFPFEPYGVQRKYMSNVIQSLEEKRHAILESPTGTGKTLCLLCSTLGWISHQKEKLEKWRSYNVENSVQEERNKENQKKNVSDAACESEQPIDGTNRSDEGMPLEKIPKVIYASRTHSQISQAMKELKKCDYADVKTAVIASRDYLCNNPSLKDKSNAEKTHKCRSLKKHDQCEYYVNLKHCENEPEFEKPILDIEDLGRIGEKFNCCSYYASRKRIQTAEIVFMPYNYLLDPKIRNATQIDLSDSIVILDEAHNVEKMCEDSACTLIKSSDICTAISDLKQMIRLSGLPEALEREKFTLNDIQKLQWSLETWETDISNVQIGMQDGGFVFSLLEKAEITIKNCHLHMNFIDKLIGVLNDEGRSLFEGRRGKGLEKVLEFLRVAFSSSADDLIDKVKQSYIVQIDEDEKCETVGSKILNFWCFSPAFGMKYLFEQGIRCLILTSGTLAPLEPLVDEMDIKDPLLLTNEHIIKDSQVFVRIIDSGLDENTSFNSIYRNRRNPKYLRSLGNSIIKISKEVPGGLLIFFASYPAMDNCVNFWKLNDNIWSKMEAQKPICVECKDKMEFERQKQIYNVNIENNNGAIFMAVLRGKVSEGVDFADTYGRCCLIVGIPFSFKDPKLSLKLQYLEGKERGSSSKWEVLEAIRAVNQAIGRVIRHKDDYGAILFCDERFYDYHLNKDISFWVKSLLPQTRETPFGFRNMLNEMQVFFAECDRTLPKSKPKPRLENVNDDVTTDQQTFKTYIDRFTFAQNVPEYDDEVSDDFINDDSIDDQYSESSEDLRPKKRKKQKKTKSFSHTSPKPSTSRIIRPSSGSSSEDDEIQIKPKRLKNATFSKKTISSDSDSSSKEDPKKEVFESHFNSHLQEKWGPDKYEEFEKRFAKYKTDKDFESFGEALFEIFNDDREHLRGMIWFLIPNHRNKFKAALEKII
ncbi:regulator of telomere elongation helicase 1 homolog [Contarinia nasturtii]|uniref:regulator of telomere elongation helicase 1 homolog n=1 Tax=Contarinia nasturtii TaxID=265458 RepID=UPI0012D3CD37|nr:regulator of telomere elongation helicase 1 homolog [Contarinia nasturtii]